MIAVGVLVVLLRFVSGDGPSRMSDELYDHLIDLLEDDVD